MGTQGHSGGRKGPQRGLITSQMAEARTEPVQTVLATASCMMSTAVSTPIATKPVKENKVALDVLKALPQLSSKELDEVLNEAARLKASKRKDDIQLVADVCAEKIRNSGFDWNEVIAELKQHAPAGAAPKTRAARGSKGEKTFTDLDSTGARPVSGTTYFYNGVSWTKSLTGKGSNKVLLGAVKDDGKTWAELEKKSAT